MVTTRWRPGTELAGAKGSGQLFTMHSLDPRNSFDLLRMLAAFAVVYTHSLRLFDLGKDPLLRVVRDDLSSFGVMVFFAISGYLVTRSAARTRSYSDYFRNRLLRIYPGLLGCLCVSVFLVGPLATVHSVRDYFSDWHSMKYFLNLLLFPLQTELPGVFLDNPRKGTVNGSLWTLSSEFICYCMVPLVFLFGRRPWVIIAGGAGSLFAYYVLAKAFNIYPLLYRQIVYNDKGEYFFLLYYNRIDGARLICVFLLGALLNFVPSRWLSWRVACGLLAGLLMSARTPLYELVAVTSIPYAAVAFGRINAKLHYPHGFDISYGVYLYHAPLMQLVWTLTHDVLQPLGQLGVGLAATVVAATISWFLIEQPALGLKRSAAGAGGTPEGGARYEVGRDKWPDEARRAYRIGSVSRSGE